jgi:hypothetical protein
MAEIALGINGRNGSENVKETNGKSNLVLDKGTFLKTNIQSDKI